MTIAPALELRGIQKRFGSVQALRGADFSLAAGEVHALLGENGAGKTTLMRIAYGLVRPDAGAIAVDGSLRDIHSPRQARRLGIGMVHQHFTSVAALTVAENVALAAGWRVDGGLATRTRALGDRLGLPLDSHARVADLSVVLKQRLEIVKALAADARILLLDEPTAVLAPAEAAELLRVIRQFANAGGSAVLITHKLGEALAAADRVTVLRHGEVTARGAAAEQSAAGLARAMIGEQERGDLTVRGRPSGLASQPEESREPVLLRLEEVEIARETGVGIAVRRAALSVRAGEIVGVAGVEGNGQRELLRAVAGRLRPLRGRREVAGPLAFVPEDRATEGLIPELTLAENVVLGSRADDPWIRHGRVDWRVARDRTAALLHEYGIVARGPDARAAELSGGNQQKLVLARELARQPRVVVAENPTRGLDLRATAAIHERLRRAATLGAAVLFASSDLDEIVALAHRVVVAARGAIVAMTPGATREEIGQTMVAGAR